MSWIGRFQKDTDRPIASNVGLASADWMDGETVICTYSQRVEGVADKAGFKANAIEYKDKFIADAAKNETLGSALTNYLNA